MLTELDRQDTDTSGDHTAYPDLREDTLADNLQGKSALKPLPRLPPAYPLRIALSSVYIKNERAFVIIVVVWVGWISGMVRNCGKPCGEVVGSLSVHDFSMRFSMMECCLSTLPTLVLRGEAIQSSLFSGLECIYRLHRSQRHFRDFRSLLADRYIL